MHNDIQLINNTDIHNFEMFVEGHRAFIDYQLKHDKVFLIHTEVPVELEGHGVAGAIEDSAKHVESRVGERNGEKNDGEKRQKDVNLFQESPPLCLVIFSRPCRCRG